VVILLKVSSGSEMSNNPDKREDRPGADEHGPRPADRIPASQYTRDFLRRLGNKVYSVGDDWDGDPSHLPHGVNWVLYPNGDLQRVGFD
jgi:hypothetical protein